jgi:hypothetical protein
LARREGRKKKKRRRMANLAEIHLNFEKNQNLVQVVVMID